MQELLDRIEQLNIASSTVRDLADKNRQNVVGVDFLNDEEKQTSLVEILYETRELYENIVEAVEQGHINPSRKHGKELSILVNCILYNYSICAMLPTSVMKEYHFGQTIDNKRNKQKKKKNIRISSISHECQRVLKTLQKEWNLDIQNSHYEHAISVANQEQNYEMASNLFERQIDPNAGGNPVPVVVHNPQGLYAIAMHYSQHKDGQIDRDTSLAAEHVMDAVQRLVMVSPQDQTNYVLAAGNALGYAGRCDDLKEYWKTSFLSQQWGTPLVAAVMQACYLCSQPQMALEVLRNSNLLDLSSMTPPSDTVSTTPGFGGEWQYGGERDRVDPLIRDLAMRVVTTYPLLAEPPSDDEDNFLSPESTSVSRIALDLFHQSREEGVTISLEAVLSVLHACEQEQEWEEALSVFQIIVDEEEQKRKMRVSKEEFTPWIVPGNSLSIWERDRPMSSARDRSEFSSIAEMGDLLASVMRGCNKSSNFGISIFCFRLFQLCQPNGIEVDERLLNIDSTQNLEDSMRHLLSHLDDSDDVLTASMIALCWS